MGRSAAILFFAQPASARQMKAASTKLVFMIILSHGFHEICLGGPECQQRFLLFVLRLCYLVLCVEHIFGKRGALLKLICNHAQSFLCSLSIQAADVSQ